MSSSLQCPSFSCLNSFLHSVYMGFTTKGKVDDLDCGHTQALNCPRCGSADTKFCYYNNYNKSQPRHLCKACNRHWTRGGTLRNLPARKNKRTKTSSAKATILYQAMIGSPSTTLDGTPQDLIAGIEFDLNNEDMMMISDGDHNLDLIQESSVCTIHPSPSPWIALDLPHYWDGIQALTADDLNNAAWDHNADS